MNKVHYRELPASAVKAVELMDMLIANTRRHTFYVEVPRTPVVWMKLLKEYKLVTEEIEKDMLPYIFGLEEKQS